jgi:hypothetical protein
LPEGVWHFAIGIKGGYVIVLGSYDYDVVNARRAHIQIRHIQRLCVDVACDMEASDLPEGR